MLTSGRGGVRGAGHPDSESFCFKNCILYDAESGGRNHGPTCRPGQVVPVQQPLVGAAAHDDVPVQEDGARAEDVDTALLPCGIVLFGGKKPVFGGLSMMHLNAPFAFPGDAGG